MIKPRYPFFDLVVLLAKTFITHPQEGKGDEMLTDIGLTCSLNRVYIPAHKGQKLFLKIEIVPIEITTESLPLNICLLIDKSSSMAGKKLDNAKEGAINLITQLGSKDYCGIVTFESKIDVVVPGQHVTDKSMFESKIRKISVGNTTELYEGLRKAFHELKNPLHTYYGPGKEPVRRIILLSDGNPTDKKPESAYRTLAQKIREMGTSITALGIGEDYNEDLLSAIAEESGGIWHHVTSPDDIPDVFSREVNNMKTVVYSQPQLIVALSEGVNISDIYKSEPEVYRISNITKSNNEYRIPVRDITTGEPQTVVARIAVPPRPEGEYRIGQVTVRSGAFSTTEDVVVHYTGDESLWRLETDPYSRTLFAITETQIKARNGLSGDETALKQAENQLKTLMRDAEVTKVKNMADRTVIIGEILDKTTRNSSKKEKKEAKSELTQTGR